MNIRDEQLQLPIPERCRSCAKRDTWTVAGVERNDCKAGHPMHESCEWHQPKPLGDEQ